MDSREIPRSLYVSPWGPVVSRRKSRGFQRSAVELYLSLSGIQLNPDIIIDGNRGIPLRVPSGKPRNSLGNCPVPDGTPSILVETLPLETPSSSRG